MNREVPALISNNLRTLWFMDSMRSKKETSLSMNLDPKAALKTHALQTLARMAVMAFHSFHVTVLQDGLQDKPELAAARTWIALRRGPWHCGGTL